MKIIKLNYMIVLFWLVVLAQGGVVYAYQPNTILWPADRQPVQLLLHDHSLEEISVDDIEVEVLSSLEEWNRVPCSTIQLEYAGRTEEIVTPDYMQVLEWIDDDDRWGGMGSLTAGATIINSFRNNDGELELLQVDIAFNAVDFEWRVGGASALNTSILDPQSVLTHELGHLMGLGHTSDDAAATMAPAYRPELSQRTLGLDDKQGICDLYWTAESECEGDADCRERERCVEWTSELHQETIRLCAELRGDYGDNCGIQDLNCDPCNLHGRGVGCTSMCLFTSADREEGYCTTRCEVDEDCPSCWKCNNLRSVQNPFFTCQPIVDCVIEPPMDEDPEADMGIDEGVDVHFEPDLKQDEVDDDRDASGDASDVGGGAAPVLDDGCGCSLNGRFTPRHDVIFYFLILSFVFLRYRRTLRVDSRSILKTVFMIGFLIPAGEAYADDEMTFDTEDINLKTYISFTYVEKGISNKTKGNFSVLVQDLVEADGGHSVIYEKDIKSIIGNKEYKKFVKCKDENCIMNYVNQVGGSRLLTVEILKEGGIFTFNLSLYDVADGQKLGYQIAVTDSEDEIDPVANGVVDLLRPPPAPVVQEERFVEPVIEEPVLVVSPEESWLTEDLTNYTLIGGVALLAIGGSFALLADNTQAEIQAAPHSQEQLLSLMESGERWQLTANVFLGLGIAALGTGAVFYFLVEPSESPRGAQYQPKWSFGLSPEAASLRLEY